MAKLRTACVHVDDTAKGHRAAKTRLGVIVYRSVG